jgi:hypothetical protein
VVFPNRNAFYYVLDRTSGEFLLGKPFAKQTWAKGLDDRGRPLRLRIHFRRSRARRYGRSVSGANNWYSPSFSPRTGLFYVATREAGACTSSEIRSIRKANSSTEAAIAVLRRRAGVGSGSSISSRHGELKWEHKLFSPRGPGCLLQRESRVRRNQRRAGICARGFNGEALCVIRRVVRRDRTRSAFQWKGNSTSRLPWAILCTLFGLE